MHEHMAWVRLKAGEVIEVTGVGQFVEVDNGRSDGRNPIEDEVAADETSTSGDENRFGHSASNSGESMSWESALGASTFECAHARWYLRKPRALA